MSDRERKNLRLGVVSFLNARPLIPGLADEPSVDLRYDVPSALPDLLVRDAVDVALIPVIDLARHAPQWHRVSDAGIGCDGTTLTVRVFSQVPPDRMTTLYVDGDSHTSVALARLIWSRHYGQPIRIRPLAEADQLDTCEAVLLIGDKVVTSPVYGWPVEIDLGEAWKEWTGLPFVFAAWVTRSQGDRGAWARRLEAARDQGVAHGAAIAAEFGPVHGWPKPLATDYLTRYMKYTITPEAEAGMKRFVELAAEENIIPPTGVLMT